MENAARGAKVPADALWSACYRFVYLIGAK